MAYVPGPCPYHKKLLHAWFRVAIIHNFYPIITNLCQNKVRIRTSFWQSFVMIGYKLWFFFIKGILFHVYFFLHHTLDFIPLPKIKVCLNYVFYSMWRRHSYRFLATKRDHFLFVWFFWKSTIQHIIITTMLREPHYTVEYFCQKSLQYGRTLGYFEWQCCEDIR